MHNYSFDQYIANTFCIWDRMLDVWDTKCQDLNYKSLLLFFEIMKNIINKIIARIMEIFIIRIIKMYYFSLYVGY